MCGADLPFGVTGFSGDILKVGSYVVVGHDDTIAIMDKRYHIRLYGKRIRCIFNGVYIFNIKHNKCNLLERIIYFENEMADFI